MKYKLLLMILVIGPVVNAGGQHMYESPMKEDSLVRTIALGEVTVASTVGSGKTEAASLLHILNDDVANVISRQTGVSLVNFGGRAESSILIRGFDMRSVPVYYDGIPVYVPYDGYLDLGRISSNRVSGISVSRGYTPVAYGTGALGGAVNIVSGKPDAPFEADASIGYGSGNTRKARLYMGSNLGKFFFSAYINAGSRDYFPLSSKFDTTGILGSEDGATRDNSYDDQLNAGVKIGFSPNSFDEYSLNYLRHNSSKGNPPYAGTDVQQRERFWQWPVWQKNSLYFIARKRSGTHSYIKTRVFYDDFSNLLSSFDDNSYSNQTRRYAFNSYYNDYALGANGEYSYSGLKNNHLKITAHLKDDYHSEYNDNEPARNFRDLTWSMGIEDAFQVSGKVKLLGSISYGGRQGLNAEDYNPTDSSVIQFESKSASGASWQSAVIYQPAKYHEVRIGFYNRLRFSTMKERYSYRAGFGLPNPGLLPERAKQAEIAYDGRITDHLSVSAAVFYTRLDNAIIVVYDTLSDLSQPQNTGEAESYGFEATADWMLGSITNIHAGYTWLHMENITDPGTFFTHVPAHTLDVELQFFPSDKFELLSGLRYMSKRYSTTYGTTAGSFFTINLAGSYQVTPLLSVRLSVENLLDRDYALTEGYPEPGRILYGSLRFKL